MVIALVVVIVMSSGRVFMDDGYYLCSGIMSYATLFDGEWGRRASCSLVGKVFNKTCFSDAGGGYGYDTRLRSRGERWLGSSVTGCSLNMLWI